MSPAELARDAGVSLERIAELTGLGLLRPTPAGHEPGDVDRVRLIEGFADAGVPVEVLAEATAAGAISFSSYPDLHPRSGPLSARTYGELKTELGAGRVELERIFAAFGLAEPGEASLLSQRDEQLVTALAEIAAAGDTDLVLRAVRLYGEAARRAAESVLSVFDEATERVTDAPHMPAGERYERLLHPWTRFAQLAPELGAWLLAGHLSRAIDEYSVVHTEHMLATAGYMDRRPEATHAIAFVDLSGFTRLSEERGDREAARIGVRLGELADAAARRHEGRLVKLLGDGALLRFRGVARAVAAASELMSALEAEGLPRAHVGIDAGPVISRDGDVFGRTVNTAARVSDVAPAGAIYLTEHAAAELAGELPTEAVGTIDLPGIGPTPLYAVPPATPRRAADRQ